jgi:hypothetical protein
MKRKIQAGTTSHMEPIRVYDTSSTTGGYLSGIVHNSSGLVGHYRREGQSSWTTITIVTATAGTFTSGGWAVPSSGPSGSYEVHIPNAALAAGAKWVEIEYSGVANMLPVRMFFELDGINYQQDISTAVHAGTVLQGTADTSATTTSIPVKTLNITLSVTDQVKGRVLLFKSDTATAALRGQGSPISGSSTTHITLSDALTTAPAENDSFVIV